jgi:hypothetical protein
MKQVLLYIFCSCLYQSVSAEMYKCIDDSTKAVSYQSKPCPVKSSSNTINSFGGVVKNDSSWTKYTPKPKSKPEPKPAVLEGGRLYDFKKRQDRKDYNQHIRQTYKDMGRTLPKKFRDNPNLIPVLPTKAHDLK